ncbi:MAG TPA: ATP-binding protein, partial [Solirubrobacterales bacterium]|nr:ATP-binding protein [Solirubrobacterales bacterium]
ARRLVEGFAAPAELSPRRMVDLVTAASELTANSVVHGGGGGELRTWRQDAELLVEIRDRGSRIDDPMAGRVMPPPEKPHGRGLWLANQLCDLVRIRSGEEGTTVRLHLGLD